MRKNALYLVAAMSLFALGWYGHHLYDRVNASHKSRRVTVTTKKGLTSPLLDVELPEGFSVSNEIMPFKYKVIDLVKQLSAKTKVQTISVYYRDLGEGPWFGINEHQEFNPASMMKVPVMIAWLKRAEKNPEILKKKYLFDGKEDMSAAQVYKPAYTLEAGKSYTLDALLQYMMSYSDNNATSILFNNLSPEELNRVLDEMDITNRPNDGNNSTTVHGYSGFFRILYNAAFLNREMSEKALELLTRENFPQGIVAGVHKGVVVAAKFGEFDDGKVKQLHEFGIVYHHKHPYIIGIMTQGNDFASQADAIREISALVYHEVDTGVVVGK